MAPGPTCRMVHPGFECLMDNFPAVEMSSTGIFSASDFSAP